MQYSYVYVTAFFEKYWRMVNIIHGVIYKSAQSLSAF